jgi:hypothetical protein
MTTPITLRVAETKWAPNERIIILLREALRDAKAGKIQAMGLALAIVNNESDSDMGRSTETILSFTDGWSHSLTTAVSTLAFRLNYERYTQGSVMPDPTLTDEDE